MRKRTGAGRRLNKTETADFFGVAIGTVDLWVRRGLSYEREGTNVYFNSSQVTQWLEAQASERAAGAAGPAGTLDEARVRKTNADAALAELQLQRERGEVVPIADVAKTFGEQCAAVRAKLLSIPTKLAPRVAIEADEGTCRELLAREITEALNELVGEGSTGSDAGELEAPANPDGERVGGPV